MILEPESASQAGGGRTPYSLLQEEEEYQGLRRRREPRQSDRDPRNSNFQPRITRGGSEVIAGGDPKKKREYFSPTATFCAFACVVWMTYLLVILFYDCLGDMTVSFRNSVGGTGCRS